MKKLRQQTHKKFTHINTKYNGWKNTQTSQVQKVLQTTENLIVGDIKFFYDASVGKDMFSQELLTILDRTTKGLSRIGKTTTPYTIGLYTLLGGEITEQQIKISITVYIGGWIFFILNIVTPKQYKNKQLK